MFFNIVGGALWITSLSLIGYYLGTQFPAIENYVGYIVIGFIGITTTLLIRTYIKQRREAMARKKSSSDDEDAPILMP
jgi:membrane-associated protein